MRPHSSQTKLEFTLWQTLARLFLTAQYGLAIIMAGEELPASLRARGITILTGLATVGTVTMAKVQPFFLLVTKEGEAAPLGNWAHDTALAFVAERSGLARASVRRRALARALPDRCAAAARAAAARARRARDDALPRSRGDARARIVGGGVRAQFREAGKLFSPPLSPRFSIVSLLWNCVYLVIAPSVAFWSIYARDEVGMTPTQVGNVVIWAYIGGTFGHLIAGQLVDRVGRKPTCAGFFALAAVAIVMLFQTKTPFGQYFWHISTVFLLNAALGATHVYASELFPTELRATGYGWTTNLFGRITEVAIPGLIGLDAAAGHSISWAIAVVGIGPILGALLIVKFAPETRGLTLEEIQTKLDAESEAGASKAPARS